MTPEDKALYDRLNEDEKRFLMLHVHTIFMNGIPWGLSSHYKDHIPHLIGLDLVGMCSGWLGGTGCRLTREGMAFMLRNYDAFGTEFERDFKPGGKIDSDKQYPRWRAAALESLDRLWTRDEQEASESVRG